ncbi:MAG TPA: hypothetical protein VFK13_06685 [Gemmatimonadaceae bacterium]|nr:hypothetical protein [Gemmatimonadaceae bacterium]
MEFPLPTSAADVQALRQRREDLSTQLTSAADRRQELVNELKSLPAPAQEGVLARIRLLDNRILQLESDIAVTGQQLAHAPTAALTAASLPPFVPAPHSDWDDAGMAAMFIVLIPLTLVLFRLLWKRGTAQRKMVTNPIAQDVAERMGRVEQAVDAIALEVERISEGQRFLTKIMTERPAMVPERVGE